MRGNGTYSVETTQCLFFPSICRDWSDNLQLAPWSHLDRTGTPLCASDPTVEETPVQTVCVSHQDAERRRSDHHLLRRGGEPAE